MEFKDAAERRAWLLARVEEVEKRRNANSQNVRTLRRNNRVKVRQYVHAAPGSTINQIAAALGLTSEEVWDTGLQREFIQTDKKRGHDRGQVRWWPDVRPNNDRAV